MTMKLRLSHFTVLKKISEKTKNPLFRINIIVPYGTILILRKVQIYVFMEKRTNTIVSAKIGAECTYHIKIGKVS